MPTTKKRSSKKTSTKVVKKAKSQKVNSQALLLVAVVIVSIFALIMVFTQNLIALTQPNEVYAEQGM